MNASDLSPRKHRANIIIHLNTFAEGTGRSLFCSAVTLLPANDRTLHICLPRRTVVAVFRESKINVFASPINLRSYRQHTLCTRWVPYS